MSEVIGWVDVLLAILFVWYATHQVATKDECDTPLEILFTFVFAGLFLANAACLLGAP